MNIVVPYAGRRRVQVMAALPTEAVWVPMTDDESYYRLLDTLWRAQQRFIIVEHDIVPHPGALEELWECPYAWCSFPYQAMGRKVVALGCTKFHEVLLRDRPQVLDPRDRFWAHQDGCITIGLEGQGIKVHIHEPEVRHLSKKALGEGSAGLAGFRRRWANRHAMEWTR